MTFRVFTVTFPDRELKVTTYQMPDGKLEQYLSSLRFHSLQFKPEAFEEKPLGSDCFHQRMP